VIVKREWNGRANMHSTLLDTGVAVRSNLNLLCDLFDLIVYDAIAYYCFDSRGHAKFPEISR
jgi:hypothetical protein